MSNIQYFTTSFVLTTYFDKIKIRNNGTYNVEKIYYYIKLAAAAK